ncbi:OST5 family protein [Phanerochaete sordida]|uniref:Dolichyl-diphosphooligosaccharide-protein glycosyltransferase subunit OST5 n=1 Tax=Phanerochaete sordida TaxID=48140 RepID=A0A9P3LEY6_9APHY|nr:OST5 family protein [Phanerochaete sordida]
MADYDSLASLHRNIPAFSPIVPVGLLPYLAFVLLGATFALAFYYSTLPKAPLRELGIAGTASILGGFGVVALFCSVGVYV